MSGSVACRVKPARTATASARPPAGLRAGRPAGPAGNGRSLLRQFSRKSDPRGITAQAVNDAALLEKLKMDEYVELFKMADQDGNGELEKEEFKVLLTSFERGLSVPFQAWMSDEELDGLFGQYDKDGSGSISLEEFTYMMQDEILLEGKLEEYEAAFRAADTTGNGTLGANELAQVFDAIRQPTSYMQMFNVMEKFDKDGNGQIDFEEFLRMFRDKLIDIEAIREYMMLDPTNENVFAEGQRRLINAEAGDVSMIFSGDELDDILDANPDRVVVLMVSFTWCRSCKGFQRKFQKFAEHYSECRFAKFYGNSNEKTKALFKDRLKAQGTPSFFMFKNGELIHEVVGGNSKKFEEGLRGLLQDTEMPSESITN